MPKKPLYPTLDDFIRKAHEVHNNKFDYSLIESYHNLNDMMSIICPVHGVFTQKAQMHLKPKNYACPECRKEAILKAKGASKEDFVKKSKEIFGDRFDYSKAMYKNAHTKVTIICRLHGEFKQLPSNHLKGHVGCQGCNGQSSITVESFIQKSKEVHGERVVDYSFLPDTLKNMHQKVMLRCVKHDRMYEVEINSHLRGRVGCDLCSPSAKMSKDRFLHKSPPELKVLNFDYGHIDWENVNVRSKKEKIICPVHGEFHQSLEHHLSGKNGCSRCSRTQVSAEEKSLADFVESLGVEIVRNDRNVLDGKELDIYIPSHNVAIEYNGVFWHSENMGRGKWYHYNKWKDCHDEGVRLLTIWSDDYNRKRNIVHSHIKHVLGLSDNKKIPARKCVVRMVNSSVARQFFNNNHIQGFVPSTYYVSLQYDDHVVAVASFLTSGEDYILTRYATSEVVVGGHSKIVSHFERMFNYRKLITFADLCFSDGSLYETTGWVQDKIIPPSYSYCVDGYNREHKFSFRKERFKKDPSLFHDEILTEKQLADINNLKRIWDCGKIRYTKKKVTQ